MHPRIRQTRCDPVHRNRWAGDGFGDLAGVTVPKAVWRLIALAERAGLSIPVHRARLLKALAAPRGVPDPMARVLAAFELDRTELFLVVNLFSVDPQPVRLSVLADQSGASIAEVREAFGHLDAQGVVSSPGTGRLRDDRDVMLTELGRDMTVYAVYRLVDVAKAL